MKGLYKMHTWYCYQRSLLHHTFKEIKNVIYKDFEEQWAYNRVLRNSSKHFFLFPKRVIYFTTWKFFCVVAPHKRYFLSKPYASNFAISSWWLRLPKVLDNTNTTTPTFDLQPSLAFQDLVILFGHLVKFWVLWVFLKP